MSLATLTTSGRAAMAAAIAARPLHFAWGIGAPAWDEDPDKIHLQVSLVDSVALINEIGRRLIAFVGYVVPDEEGSIAIPIGRQPDGTVIQARYAQAFEPTPHLYMRVNFDYGDASDQIIREVAIFMDTAVAPGLPPGQEYFVPADIVDPGRMLVVQRLDPVTERSPAVRQSYEFVLPI